MGVFGTGPFDNDDAMDFACLFMSVDETPVTIDRGVEIIVRVIARALSVEIGKCVVTMAEGQEALAACEVLRTVEVAHGITSLTALGQFIPEQITRWIRAHFLKYTIVMPGWLSCMALAFMSRYREDLVRLAEVDSEFYENHLEVVDGLKKYFLDRVLTEAKQK